MSAGIGHQSAEQQEDNGASSLNIGGGSQSYDVKKAQVNAEMYSLDLDDEPEKNRKLYAIAYTSELKVPEGQKGGDFLEGIFQVAVKKNLKLRIGGTLSYNEKTRTIHQYLEGPTGNVLRLLEGIEKDKRHTIRKIYTNHQISSRRFTSFGMIWASDDAAPFLWDGLRTKNRNRSRACTLQ